MTDFLATKLANEVGGPDLVQQAVYAVSTYAVLEIAQEVFHIGAGFSKVILVKTISQKYYVVDNCSWT